MRNVTTLIDRIILLPKKFHDLGNISFYGLLKSTQYFDFHNDVTMRRIYDRLKEYPECCNYWIEWSEDQRFDFGWYVQKEDENGFVVGYHDIESKISQRKFVDKCQAVAFFIKNQIEMIRLCSPR